MCNMAWLPQLCAFSGAFFGVSLNRLEACSVPLHVPHGVSNIFSGSMFTHVCCNCMIALALGLRPDGSRLLLSRPHGTPNRVGSQTFRVIFLSIGRHRTPRTIIFGFLDSSEWNIFLASNARLYLFLTCFSSSAVGTPRVAAVPAPDSPVESSEESDSDAESVC